MTSNLKWLLLLRTQLNFPCGKIPRYFRTLSTGRGDFQKTVIPYTTGLLNFTADRLAFTTGLVKYSFHIHRTYTFKVFSPRSLLAQFKIASEVLLALGRAHVSCVYWAPPFFANEVMALNWPLSYAINLISFWECNLTTRTVYDYSSVPQLFLLQLTSHSSAVGAVADPTSSLPWIFAMHQLHFLSISSSSYYTLPIYASLILPIDSSSLINQYVFMYLITSTNAA